MDWQMMFLAVLPMVKSETDDIKPIKSTISIFDDDLSEINYFALSDGLMYKIQKHIADTFKKEISEIDIFNFAMCLCAEIVTADDDETKSEIIGAITDIVNDDSKMNEFIFTRLATIKSWNEAIFEIENKYGKEKAKDISEKEFNELMEANNEKNQYKAWNDERKILDMYSKKSAKGDSDGGNN